MPGARDVPANRNHVNRPQDSTGTSCKNATLEPPALESNLQPYNSGAVLCQQSYEGCCRELGHEFFIFFYHGGKTNAY